MALTEAFRGVLPAMQVPFKPDYSLDEAELRRYTTWLAGHEGIGGLVTNGHTGEVFALSAQERAEVTRIVADEVQDYGQGSRCQRSAGDAASHLVAVWHASRACR
jgi:dihydrodipicolinate synthase/N-acetylneuraminate lyase